MIYISCDKVSLATEKSSLIYFWVACSRQFRRLCCAEMFKGWWSDASSQAQSGEEDFVEAFVRVASFMTLRFY